MTKKPWSAALENAKRSRIYSVFLTSSCWGCQRTTVYNMPCVWSWVAVRPHPPRSLLKPEVAGVVPSPLSCISDVCGVPFNAHTYYSGLVSSTVFARHSWAEICLSLVVEVMDSQGDFFFFPSLSSQRWSWRAGDERSGQLLYLGDIFISLHLSPSCRGRTEALERRSQIEYMWNSHLPGRRFEKELRSAPP